MDNAKAAILIIIILLCDFNFLLFINSTNQVPTTYLNRTPPLTKHSPVAEYIKQEQDIMTNTNQSPIPDGWTTANTGMSFGIGGVANVVLDESVTFNGASTLRIDPIGETDNLSREANSYYLPVSPGDHLRFVLYMKTSAAAVGETDRGVRFGIDMYGADGRLVGCQTPTGETWTPPNNYPETENDQFVAWGTDWTQKTMEFTVADTYPADPWANEAYTEGEYYVPTGMIPWLQVASSVDGGQGWFAAAYLYINPSASPTSVYVAHLMMMRK